jgi:hypothetical protein
MQVRAGDRDADLSEHRLGDALPGSGERSGERETCCSHQHGPDGDGHDLGANESPHWSSFAP